MIWIAHRCNTWDAITNTRNADMIEVNIAITKDNKFILHHELDQDGMIISQHPRSLFKGIELQSLLRRLVKPVCIHIKWDPRVSPNHVARQLYQTLSAFKRQWIKIYLFTFDIPLLACLRIKFEYHITIGWLIQDETLWDPHQDCDIVCADYRIAHIIATHKLLFIFTISDMNHIRHLQRIDGIISDTISTLKSDLLK